VRDASFRGEAAAPSRGNDVVLGRFTFRLVHRVVAGDRGLTLHVFGPHQEREEEVLRFDCFDRRPHYHLGWSYRAEQFVEVAAVDPLAWTLDEIERRMPRLLTRAEADPMNSVELDGLGAAVRRIRQWRRQLDRDAPRP